MAHAVCRSYLWVYVSGWMIAFSVFAYMAAKNVLRPGTREVVYDVIVILSIVVVNFVEGRRLTSYLKNNHNERWAHLTAGASGAPGGMNTFRILSFLFSSETYGDESVVCLKKNYRRIVFAVVLAFLHIPVAWVVFDRLGTR